MFEIFLNVLPTLNFMQRFKGALDKILKFSFWLNYINHVKIMIANLQIQKEKFKNSF